MRETAPPPLKIKDPNLRTKLTFTTEEDLLVKNLHTKKKDFIVKRSTSARKPVSNCSKGGPIGYTLLSLGGARGAPKRDGSIAKTYPTGRGCYMRRTAQEMS